MAKKKRSAIKKGKRKPKSAKALKKGRGSKKTTKKPRLATAAKRTRVVKKTKKKPKRPPAAKPVSKPAPPQAVPPVVVPPAPPYMTTTINHPPPDAHVMIPYNADGTTTPSGGALVSRMSRRVNRESPTPLQGMYFPIQPPYGNWSSLLTANDCPTPGTYILQVIAWDQYGPSYEVDRKFSV